MNGRTTGELQKVLRRYTLQEQQQLESNNFPADIQPVLATLAAEKGVRILYACEAGSRAWGFASSESDYDVRFIFVYPMHAYLRLDAPPDVIEYLHENIDLAGWDLYKALRLFRKSNPALLEQLFSPIVYLEESPLIARLRKLAKMHTSSVAILYHYWHMAQHNYHAYIEEKELVLTKKYLYVLRPLFVIDYLQSHRSLPPSTSFADVMRGIELPAPVKEHVLELLDRKREGKPLGIAPADPVLNEWIDVKLAAFAETEPLSVNIPVPSGVLDALARAELSASPRLFQPHGRLYWCAECQLHYLEDEVRAARGNCPGGRHILERRP
jgi:predicted nucleotidyltransferase